MGRYDSVMARCPSCGHRNEFQSKGGPCAMNTYELGNAPADVLSDVNRHAPVECRGCGTKYRVLWQPPITVKED